MRRVSVGHASGIRPDTCRDAGAVPVVGKNAVPRSRRVAAQAFFVRAVSGTTWACEWFA